MSVVRFNDLVPSWNTLHAKEEGFKRAMRTYVGGPEGYSNNNPETAVVNEKVLVGVMDLPVGQRQYGLHKHSVAEIYIVLKGRVASIDATGEEKIAGPLDCIYMPPGAYHAVRNAGTEDVQLLYFHDNLEAKGTSIYVSDEIAFNDTSSPPVQLVHYVDLVPNWGSRHATEAGHLRWLVSWVAGPEGFSNNNRGVSIENSMVNLGMMGVLPGNIQVSHKHPIAEVYMVYAGHFAVEMDGVNVELGPMDCLYVSEETYHSVRCLGPQTGLIIYLHDRLAPKDTTVWEK